jgi:hypothetical protein
MMIYSRDELISEHEIADGDTLSFTRSTMGGWSPFQFESKHGDSIYLSFADNRYLSFADKHDLSAFKENNIFLGRYYRRVNIAKHNYVFYWEFTAEDYENATEREP